MKKFLLLISIPLLLTGCFGSSDTSTTDTTFSNPNYNTYEGTGFSIPYPKDWGIIDGKSFTSNVPAETIVAFRNNIKNEVFTANTNISKTQIPETITSEDFGKSTLLKSKESLVGFNELSKEEISFLYGTLEIKTFISGFEGKKTPSDPVVRFKQLYLANQGEGYVITSAYLPTEDESVVKMCDEMLHSFSLK